MCEFHDDVRTYVVPAELNDVAWTYIDSFVAEKLSTRVERDEIGDAWTTRAGKFPKRVQKYLRRKGIKAAPEIVSEIGNIASRHVAQQSTYHVDFTQTIDWRAGQFGDGGSCYWGTNAGARDMLAENGAYAIRFYDDDERGIGRAWLAPYGNSWIMFNSYGLDLFTVARVMSHAFGWTYQRIRLENQGTATGVLYINSGRGIAIGPGIDDVCDNDCVDLEWQETGERCENCGCDCTDDYDMSPNGERLCCDCFSEAYSSCGYCGEACCHEDIHNCDDDWYCESCAERKGFSACHSCAEWSQTVHECTDGEHRCDDCITDWSPCDSCGLLADDVTEFCGEFHCGDCITDIAVECDCCHVLATAAEVQHLDGRAFCCDDCRDGIPVFQQPAVNQLELAFA